MSSSSSAIVPATSSLSNTAKGKLFENNIIQVLNSVKINAWRIQ
jgi:hypothetical protein